MSRAWREARKPRVFVPTEFPDDGRSVSWARALRRTDWSDGAILAEIDHIKAANRPGGRALPRKRWSIDEPTIFDLM